MSEVKFFPGSYPPEPNEWFDRWQIPFLSRWLIRRRPWRQALDISAVMAAQGLMGYVPGFRWCGPCDIHPDRASIKRIVLKDNVKQRFVGESWNCCEECYAEVVANHGEIPDFFYGFDKPAERA